MGGFAGRSGNTVPSHLSALVGADPSLPLLTHYDDGSGERTELSGATLANWVAKTANLLVDGLGLGASAHAAVWLPPHWQTAAVLLGAWHAGLVGHIGEPRTGPADVVFATVAAIEAGAVGTGDERFALGLAPMGLPLRDVPAGWTDYIAAVRGHGDFFNGPPVSGADPALAEGEGPAVSHEQLVVRARDRAAQLGVPAAGRVLIDGDARPDPVDWLLAPLVVGTAVVLCTHTDRARLDARAESEKAALLLP